MPFGMEFGELALILIIVVVVFGSRRLPELSDTVQGFLRGRAEWAAALLALILAGATIALLLRGYG